jgi:DSF synthase
MTYLHKPVMSTELAETRIGPGNAFGVDRQATPLALAHLEVAAMRHDTLDLNLDSESRTLWCHMRPAGRPSFTVGLMQDIIAVQRSIKQMFAERAERRERQIEWFVLGSRFPGVYNLGGDLGLFAECIRTHDIDTLRHYGYVAVEAIHRNHTAFDCLVVTIALVQGDALGGGFEAALAHDLIVAERSAKFGLPEVLFNLFPGMGAASFLSRRIPAAEAQKLILSGKVYSAEELHAMGIVDVVAEDGMGDAAVHEYIERHGRKHNAIYHTRQALRRANPVTLDELHDIVDLWAEAALNLSEADLRKMARLTAAQDRRLAAVGYNPRAVAIAAE